MSLSFIYEDPARNGSSSLQDYSLLMKAQVLPYVKARSFERFYFREKDRPVFCLRCFAEHPAGVLVISHGFRENAEKYKELIYYFLQAGLHVYLPEHCSHGRSYSLKPGSKKVHADSYCRYVRDLAFIAAKAKQENPALPLYLLGHSMGGGIGACVLARYPGLFQKAVLCAPMIFPRIGLMPPSLAFAAASLFCGLGYSDSYSLGQHDYSGKKARSRKLSDFRGRLLYDQELREKNPAFQTGGATWSWVKEAYRMGRFLLGLSPKDLSLPLLLLQAQKDRVVLKAPQRRFLSRFPRGRLLVIKNAGHEIFRSRDEILKTCVNQVLNFYLKETK